VREADFVAAVICEFDEVVMVSFDVRVDDEAVVCDVPIRYVISEPVGRAVGISVPVKVLPPFVKVNNTGL